ncbi:MAG: anti-CBASS protein Acb1 family protein [bacterium]
MKPIEEAKQTARRRDQARLDLFMNAYNGFGGATDPMARMYFGQGTVLTRTDAEHLYRFDWVSRRIVEVVAEDAIRPWITITIDRDKDKSRVTGLTGRMEELRLQKKILQAAILSRLYGGSVIIIGALDGGSPEKPLNEDTISRIAFFNVLDRWQLTVESRYSDPMKANFGEPEIYRLSPVSASVYAPRRLIHESRLVRFDGAFLPDVTRLENDGWYDSELQPINEEVKRFGTSLQGGAVLFQDFITKVLKLPNLADLLQTTEGQTALQARIQYAIANASSIGITLLGEDEEFTKIQTPITGLVDLMNLYIEIVCAAARVPRARLFSQQLGVLAGATETTRAYYDMVASWQKDKLQDQIEKIIRIMLRDRSSKTGSREPEEWGFTFNPLWQPTSKEQAEERKLVAETDAIYIDRQVVLPEEVAASRFGPDGYSMETTLDGKLRAEFERKVKENGL